MTEEVRARARQAWQDAQFALMALQIDPVRLGGIWLRAGHGPVRDSWLQRLQAVDLPLLKVPNQVDDERLLGGIDLAQTLQSSRLVQQAGLLAQAHGGTLVLPMAERLPVHTVAHIAQAQDRGMVHARDAQMDTESRFGIVALDESEEDESGIAPRLSDRLGIWLDLHGNCLADTQDKLEPLSKRELAEARALLPRIETTLEHAQALCQTAVALGVDSLRAPLMALRLACVRAALEGRDAIDEEDLSVGASLVLGPRATRIPAAQQATEEQPPEPAPPDGDDAPPEDDASPDTNDLQEPLQDVLLAAALANLPPKLLDRLLLGRVANRNAQGLGSSGQAGKSWVRGRPLTPRPGKPGAGARLHVLATLRAAAPKQKLRNNPPGSGHVRIRAEDFHVRRFEQRTDRKSTRLNSSH